MYPRSWISLFRNVGTLRERGGLKLSTGGCGEFGRGCGHLDWPPERGEVISIQAVPQTFDLLCGNLKRNARHNVKAVNVAATQNETTVEIVRDDKRNTAWTGSKSVPVRNWAAWPVGPSPPYWGTISHAFALSKSTSRARK